ncbi:unnamed protein product [Cylicocyclus nassatus]|uniref:Solute carrier family 3 member 2 N-terminal domain-containing protein n=1 Tax=Cylicocyclus nassatus TaxID=53992 RepID=A0AA36DJ52_CYLNA|nr:unnamed protein product [Cylicocyclus nassatus]
MSSTSETTSGTESTSNTESSTSRSDAELYLKPLIGLTAEQLKIAQQSAFWKFWRVTIIVVFWVIWTGMVTGAILIIVLNNGDLPKTTTTTAPRTTAHQ